MIRAYSASIFCSGWLVVSGGLEAAGSDGSDADGAVGVDSADGFEGSDDGEELPPLPFGGFVCSGMAGLVSMGEAGFSWGRLGVSDDSANGLDASACVGWPLSLEELPDVSALPLCVVSADEIADVFSCEAAREETAAAGVFSD